MTDGEIDEDTDDFFELTEQQDDALELCHNIAVRAGAGTGKTRALTARYLRILEATAAGPEDIVTITFTNDAANELQDRIRDAIVYKLDHAAAGSYESWRQAKDDLADAFIHTIHGFCARLLREYAVEAPVTPEFEVYDETDSALLGREIARNVVGDRLTEGARDVTRLAQLWDRETVEDVLVGLLGERPASEQWADRWVGATTEEYLDFVWETVHPISPGFAVEVLENGAVREALSTFRELEADGVMAMVDPGDDQGAAKIESICQLLVGYEPLQASTDVRDRQQFLDELCNLLTTSDGTRHGHDWWYWGSQGRWSDAGVEAEQDRLESAIETLFSVVDPEALDFGVHRDETAAHYVTALANLFDGVSRAYAEAKSRRNVLDYDDLIETTIEFLESNLEARAELQGSFDFVMVDEVQDTDPRQWRLVQLLTSDDPEIYDGQNVFLVGDEKQSIFRFRGADVTSFAAARRDLVAANPDDADTELELSGNFRSSREVLHFANDVFNELFVPLTGAGFQPFEASPQELSCEREGGSDVNGQCEYLLVPHCDEPELHGPGYLDAAPRFSEPGDREAYAVAARLTRLFDDPPTVYDREAEAYRAARPEDVTVLFRSRTRLKSYERAFDALDIPYTVESGTGFYETPEVTAIVNLLRVLEDPSNERALYGLLRSPMFGIPDETLARLRAATEGSNLWRGLCAVDDEPEMQSSDTETLADARELIASWRRRIGAEESRPSAGPTPWGTLISQVVDETGFIASVAGDERPRQAAANINRLREQLRNWEEAGIKTPAGMVSRIETRREIEAHSGEAAIPEDSDEIQLRTVHSAKGLEFNIVVVPELATEFNFQANVDEYGRVYFEEFDLGDGDGKTPVLGIKAPSREDPYTTDDTLVRRVTRDRMQAHERAELKRLLYVAMTRTRDHLILSGVHEIEDSEDGSFVLSEPADRSEAGSWLDWLQPILLERDDDGWDEALLAELSEAGMGERELPESRYHVCLPASPAEDWEGDSASTEPSFSVDIPSIPEQEPPIVLTATDYAELVSGAESAESGPEVGDLGTGPDGELESRRSWSGGARELRAGTLGDIVHRICERRPDRDGWVEYANDVARMEGVSLSDADSERILEYAQRAIEFVDDYQRSLDVESIHDEFAVAARLDGGRIEGEIDRLIVTSDTYHIIDYKTNDLSQRDIDDLVEYYRHQMEAYALALHQSHSNRSVHWTLYFTDGPEVYSEKLNPADLDEILDSISDQVHSYVASST